MAMSKLSGDEQGTILGQLCNTLEPRLAMYFMCAMCFLAMCFLVQVRRPRAASAATPRLRPTHATLPTPRAAARPRLARSQNCAVARHLSRKCGPGLVVPNSTPTRCCECTQVSRNKKELAHWARAFSNETHLDKKHRRLKVAVGALADAAVQAVKADLGNFTGLLGLVDTLRAQVMNMSWSSNESSERKAAVEYDKSTGQYAVLIIERQSSAKDFTVSFVGAKTYTVKLKVKFHRAQAENDAARKICQTLVDQAVGGLVQQIEAMTIF